MHTFPVIRRALALAVAFAMLNLTTAGAEAVCASHGDHARPAGTIDGAHADHSAHSAAPTSDAPDAGSTEREQCDTPTGSDCCPVAITCSFSFGAMQVASVMIAQSARETPQAMPALVVRSPRNGPEPPPPRA